MPGCVGWAILLQLKNYINGVLPEIDYRAIVHKADIATRSASANVLLTPLPIHQGDLQLQEGERFCDKAPFAPDILD